MNRHKFKDVSNLEKRPRTSNKNTNRKYKGKVIKKKKFNVHKKIIKH